MRKQTVFSENMAIFEVPDNKTYKTYKSFPMFEKSENIRLIRLIRGERVYIEKV